MSTVWALLFPPLGGLMLVLVLGLQAWWRPGLQGAPALRWLAVLCAVLGLHPTLDALARNALCLHALQMLCLHHLVPRLWWHGGQGLGARPPACGSTASAAAFGVVTVVWMLPSVHPWLMRDGGLYSLMNLTMLMSGLWWTLGAPGVRPGPVAPATTARGPFPLLGATLPQALLGAWLVCSPPQYVADLAWCAAVPDLDLAAWQRSLRTVLSAEWDQRLAGGLFLLGAVGQAWAQCRAGRVCEGSSPNSAR